MVFGCLDPYRMYNYSNGVSAPMGRKASDTDLTAIGWELLAPLIPPEKRGGAIAG